MKLVLWRGLGQYSDPIGTYFSTSKEFASSFGKPKRLVREEPRNPLDLRYLGLGPFEMQALALELSNLSGLSADYFLEDYGGPHEGLVYGLFMDQEAKLFPLLRQRGFDAIIYHDLNHDGIQGVTIVDLRRRMYRQTAKFHDFTEREELK